MKHKGFHLKMWAWSFIVVIWGLLFFGFNTQIHEVKSPVDKLEAHVPQWMHDWHVPGMAIAIVHHGKVIMARGYGVLKVGTKDSVDADTLFAVGSITKGFTSAALGLLVDRGQLSFDTIVSEILPIKWNDEKLTHEITVRDLLAHRTGLEKSDIAWYRNGRTREDILAILKHIPSGAPLRSTFLYHNITYLTAGQLIPQLTGRSWDRFVREEFLNPLQMRRTLTSASETIHERNIATPHIIANGTLIPIERENNDNAGPAGAIYSSVNDMCQWLRFWLNRGHPFLSESTFQDIVGTHNAIPMDSMYALGFPLSSQISYGLGWFLYDYQGHQIFEHSGKVDGMMAQLTVIPDEELGIIILTNSNNLGLPLVIKYTFLDTLFGTQFTFDWNQHALAGVQKLEEVDRRMEKEKAEQRKSHILPTKPLEAYCGIYTHPLYGELTITYRENALHASMKPFEGKMSHWERDSFYWDLSEAMPERPLKALIRFEEGRLVLSAEEIPPTLFERKIIILR